MKRSYLIQRLKKPHGNGPNAKLLEAFSFGGGCQNGGIPEEGMKILREIFSFDYMGSAEFEWGAVPEALNGIANNIKRYGTFAFPIDGKWVYIICEKVQLEEIKKRIIGFAKRDPEYRTKEPVNLNTSLSGKYSWNDEKIPENRLTKGWLEIDNGYFFFIDRDMFEATAKLFGLKMEANNE